MLLNVVDREERGVASKVTYQNTICCVGWHYCPPGYYPLVVGNHADSGWHLF